MAELDPDPLPTTFQDKHPAFLLLRAASTADIQATSSKATALMAAALMAWVELVVPPSMVMLLTDPMARALEAVAATMAAASSVVAGAETTTSGVEAVIPNEEDITNLMMMNMVIGQ